MSVEMVRIAFDHAVGPAETRALHIRTDGNTPAPADVAAYALAPTKGKQLTVEAELRFPNLGGAGLAAGTAVRVRAQTTAASATVLGKVQARDVIVPAVGQTGTFVFELSAPKLHTEGIGKYTVAWEWQFRLTPTSAWVPFHTSAATIYITLDVPTEPWTQAADAASQRTWPWTRMLNLACDWASGLTLAGGKSAAVKKVAKRVETAVYGLGTAGKFDYRSIGDSRYLVGPSAGIFKVGTFIDDIEGPAQGFGIDCGECTMAVATAVNCLGGDLRRLRLDRPTASLHLNSHVRIGKTTANEGNFSIHDVAVRKNGSSRQVFDATLRPDWDVDVSDGVHDYELTQGRQLGKREVKPEGKKYLQRLLEGDVLTQWDDLEMFEVVMPCLDECEDAAPPSDPNTELQFVRRLQEIQKVVPAVPIAFPFPDAIKPLYLDGFRLVRRVDAPARLAALAPLVSGSAEFWYVSTSDRPEKNRGARHFKIAVAWSPNPEAAQKAMAWLMVRTNAPLPVFPPKKAKLGDAAHGSARDSVVYMVRGNVLIQLVGVGKTQLPAELIAQQADQAIQADWSNQLPIRGRQGPSGRGRPSSAT
jgi:hypothetical protein